MSSEVHKREEAKRKLSGEQKEDPTNKENPKRKNSDESTGDSNHHLNVKEMFKHYIGNYVQAPQFIKDNVYIHSGYRINFGSLKSVFKTLFMVHNEMVNIWSHFLGAVLVVIICVFLMTSFGNIDIDQFKKQLVDNVSSQLQPIYNELKELDDMINVKVSSGVDILKKDYNILEDKVVDNFNSLINEFAHMKDEITHANIDVDAIVQKFKQFSFKQYYDEIDLQALNTFNKNVLSKLNELKENMITQIDSKEFDWMDFHMSEFMNYHEPSEGTNKLSRWPIFVFLFSAFLCLICSTAFHLFHPVNPKLYKVFLRLDYAGVSLLISGSTAPGFYYGFYCAPHLAYTYLSAIFLASLIVFFVSLQDFIHTPKYFTVKSVMYGGLGVFAAIPMGHLVYSEFFDHSLIGNFSMANSMLYYGLMGVCYLGGLTIYATRCPERYNPGKFDICGASHQLWHISILLAIIVTYVASLINFYTRKMSTCPA